MLVSIQIQLKRDVFWEFLKTQFATFAITSPVTAFEQKKVLLQQQLLLWIYSIPESHLSVYFGHSERSFPHFLPSFLVLLAMNGCRVQAVFFVGGLLEFLICTETHSGLLYWRAVPDPRLGI